MMLIDVVNMYRLIEWVDVCLRVKVVDLVGEC